MPVRIYALAKQLKIDNQSLIDACKKAGVTVKGSALASLSDEEVAKVKAFLGSKGAGSRSAGTGTAAAGRRQTKGGAGAGKGTADSPTVLRREDYIAPGGAVPKKVPVLKGKPEKLSPEGEKPPESTEAGAAAAGKTDTKPEEKKGDKPERQGPAPGEFDPLVAKLHPAGSGGDQQGQDLKQSGLAGAVGTQQGADRAPRQGQPAKVQHGTVAVYLPNVFQPVKHGIIHGFSPEPCGKRCSARN